MMGLEHRQEKPLQGRIPTFAHRVVDLALFSTFFIFAHPVADLALFPYLFYICYQVVDLALLFHPFLQLLPQAHHKTSQVNLLGQVSHRQEHLPLQRDRQAPGWLEGMEDLPAVSKRSRPQMENFALDLSTPSPLARPL